MEKLIVLLCCLGVFGCSNPLAGLVGPAGEQGPKGEQGAPGVQGEQGPAGSGDGTSGKRLKRQYRTSADGGKAFDSWYDTELGTPCAWRVDAEGDERCFPIDERAAKVEIVYLDSACTFPVGIIEEGECGIVPPAFTYTTSAACGARAKLLLAPIEKPALGYEMQYNNNCKSFPVYPTDRFFGISEDLDPIDLIVGSVSIE